jgi:branched-chain amino acid aminotransferase
MENDTLSIDMSYPIEVTTTESSRIHELNMDGIAFGSVYTDHMFVADYYDGSWHDARIVPYEQMLIPPSTAALHYGQAIFEGMKAYRSHDGEAQLFRPDRNIKRFNYSADRMAMPDVPEELFYAGLKQLIKLDRDWIPSEKGSSLYIRPFMIATNESIGVKPADRFRFMIICCPVGPYYTRPVKVMVTDKYVRAFEGGVGSAKAAGNYGAAMRALKEARESGYDQILWTDGVEHEQIHEIGTMNVFFLIDGVAITPEVSDTILEGVTRDSVITMLKKGGVPVEERKITVSEVAQAHSEGKLTEVFGTGTAATIAQIITINYKGQDLELPEIDQSSVSYKIKEELEQIRASRAEDKHGWIVKV